MPMLIKGLSILKGIICSLLGKGIIDNIKCNLIKFFEAYLIRYSLYKIFKKEIKTLIKFVKHLFIVIIYTKHGFLFLTINLLFFF